MVRRSQRFQHESAHAPRLLERDGAILRTMRGDKDDDEVFLRVDDLADPAEGRLEIVGRRGRKITRRIGAAAGGDAG